MILKQKFDDKFVKPFFYQEDGVNCVSVDFKPDYQKILMFIEKEIYDAKRESLNDLYEKIDQMYYSNIDNNDFCNSSGFTRVQEEIINILGQLK